MAKKKSTDRPRGAGGKFISKQEAENITPEDLPKLVHKSSKMTGALKDLKQVKEESELDKPLVSVSLNNPIAWFLKWLNKLKKRQTTTISFRLGVPLIALPVLIVALATVFLGFLKTTTPEMQENQIEKPADSYILSRAGTLRVVETDSEFLYFLILADGEAIRLIAPEAIDLSGFDDKRILASGSFNKSENTLTVENLADLEILPESKDPIPTSPPMPSPTLAPSATSSPSTIIEESLSQDSIKVQL